MLSPNTILRKRYRIIQLLGHGGMGAVYQAIDENLNRLVAVKEAFGSSDELRRAFRREAELLGNLRHRSLPKSIEQFSENNNDYFVMEFVPGHDLAELMKLRGNPFPESEVLGWADEVLAVLAYLHGQKLIHRDIKPSNIKLTKEGELFLIDFGLAKGAVGQMGTLVTSQSVRGYTPAYASLEQILGQGTDARSDIYSVGATFYHLLAGVAPLNASTRFQMIDDEGKDPLPPIQHENPLVSPHVAGIIHSAMAINRKRRPENAEQMREALQAAAREGAQGPSATRPKPPDPNLRSTEPPPPDTPISTIPAPQPKRHYWNTRMITGDDAGSTPVDPTPIDPTPVDPSVIPTPPGKSTTKVLVITAGVILLLVAASVGAVALKTGWLPWRDKNLYDDGQTDGASNNNNANSSPVVVASPSPDKPTVQTPSPGSVVRNQIGMELVWIPAGSFRMGSTNGDERERPVHEVTINYSFYLGKFEVTQSHWKQVMGEQHYLNVECGGDCPVLASWNDAQRFIQRLNALSDGYTYRLPSEAEWEYACRAGTNDDYAGDWLQIAWFAENSNNKVHSVGQKQLNGWGIGDMRGNLAEWCDDWYHTNYEGAPVDGSSWLTGGEPQYRIVRGGSFVDTAVRLGCSFRSRAEPGNLYSTTGFRVVGIPQSR